MLYQLPEQQIDAKLIKYYIDKSQKRSDEMFNLYKRYCVEKEGVPIMSRRYMIDNEEQKDKINHKINNDFFSEIVDIKVGFFAGVPITVMLDKKPYTTEQYESSEKALSELDLTKPIKTNDNKKVSISPQYEIDNESIQYFNKLNSIDDLNIETAKKAAICGLCGRLLYIEEGSGDLRVTIRDPWSCIFFGDSVDAPKVSIYHYSVESRDEKGNTVKTYYAYLYDDKNITTFTRKDKDEDYTPGEIKDHVFGENPLIGIANNEEFQGDAEKVLSLIDSYDRTESDLNNEIEQFRLAYMVATGCNLPEQTIKDARKSGAFSVPTGTIGFLTKIADINSILAFMKVLADNIYRFSKTPNMQSLSASGNASSLALEINFRGFEYKCVMSEQKFKKSERQMYKLVSNILNKTETTINYLDLSFVFTRNYPRNLLEEADIQMKLKGVVSDKTRLSLASFVEDPEKEAEEMGKDTEQAMANAVSSVYANSKDTGATDNLDRGGVNDKPIQE